MMAGPASVGPDDLKVRVAVAWQAALLCFVGVLRI